jgi:hypothetical protein
MHPRSTSAVRALAFALTAIGASGCRTTGGDAPPSEPAALGAGLACSGFLDVAGAPQLSGNYDVRFAANLDGATVILHNSQGNQPFSLAQCFPSPAGPNCRETKEPAYLASAELPAAAKPARVRLFVIESGKTRELGALTACMTPDDGASVATSAAPRPLVACSGSAQVPNNPQLSGNYRVEIAADRRRGLLTLNGAPYELTSCSPAAGDSGRLTCREPNDPAFVASLVTATPSQAGVQVSVHDGANDVAVGALTDCQ